MKSETKIHLSTEESELVQNSGWILQKHVIIKKVFELFGSLSESYSGEIMKYELPAGLTMNGKISKGENYLLLPYVILDQPATFSKAGVFAIRTMFWWGNFFSITLHVSGDYKKYISLSKKVHDLLSHHHFYICINDGEWEHHFGDDNYRETKVLTDMEWSQITAKDFLKISKKIPLTDWDKATAFLLEGFHELMQLINFRDGKTDL